MADISNAGMTTSDDIVYTRVIVKSDGYDSGEAKQYTSGNDTGRTMEIMCPWASQSVADSLLASISGKRYKPYSAKSAVTDPAIELGDGIEVGGGQSSIQTQDITFSGIMRSDISAPGEEELEHEFQYTVNRDRKLTRQFTAQGAAIREVEEMAVQTEAGLQQITQYDPETGYAIAEEALYATILDNTVDPPAIKTSRISSSVVRDADGNLKSLASILADVIQLNGRVDLTGYLIVRNGWVFGDTVSVNLLRTGQLNMIGSGTSGDMVFSPERITFYGSINSSPARYDRYSLTTGEYVDSGVLKAGDRLRDATGQREYRITYPGGGSGGDPITRTVLTSQGSAQSPMSVSEEDN